MANMAYSGESVCEQASKQVTKCLASLEHWESLFAQNA
jgi:hypothetical protein